jgi:hypothetical protein
MRREYRAAYDSGLTKNGTGIRKSASCGYIYKLMEMIDEELQPGEEKWPAEVFWHMANSGKRGPITRPLHNVRKDAGRPRMKQALKRISRHDRARLERM